MARLYFVTFWFFLTAQPCYGLEITSRSLSPTYAAVGNSVTLICHFSLAPEDLGVLDIEWTTKPARLHADETVIAWYAGNQIRRGFAPLTGRINFMSPNPASGDASITISELTPRDTNRYQCKVRKLPGISMAVVQLDVKQKPSTPECNLNGTFQLGQKVVLGCKSTEGSLPIWYTWSRDGEDTTLPNGAHADSANGNLYFTVTEEHVEGTYICRAHNNVGMETCLLTLPFNSTVHAYAVAASVTVLLAIITSVLIFTLLVKFCHYRTYNVQDSVNEPSVETRFRQKQKLDNSSRGQRLKPPGSFVTLMQANIKIDAPGNGTEKDDDEVYVLMDIQEVSGTSRECHRRDMELDVY